MANKSLKLTKIALFLLVVIAGSTNKFAQQRAPQTSRPLNYGFVSPNTREAQTINDAIKLMNAPEETALLRKAVNLGCVVRSRVSAVRALGSWSDGAEQSLLLRIKTDESSIRYLLSRLGQDAKQKSILYFHPGPKGTATIYTLTPRRNTRNLVDLANKLEREGISFRTLVPNGKSTLIYVVDSKQELKVKVLNVAKRLRARVNSEKGTAEFVGADEVPQASTVFAEEIRRYESKNPNLPPTCDVRRGRAKS